MGNADRPLAIVTGASTGIGRELARCCAAETFDLVIAADEPEIHEVAQRLSSDGARVDAANLDLSTPDGIEELLAMVRNRPIAALLANAGRGLGHAFLDQNFDHVMRVLNTNITGTIYLLHKVGSAMRDQRSGRILIVGSIAGYVPGTYQAVYSASKSFIDSFSFALRSELQDFGVTVTCLMPGVTDTEFFRRAGMLDTQLAQGKKDNPADVAAAGFKAMMNGDGYVVSGWQNKLLSAAASITPSSVLAEIHSKQTEPGSGKA